ncbi:MAG: hypothetical protein UR63_C0044G0017 [Candidatus Roizmanbacteria bacterium GW2011_GWC2_35_12]|uniref:Uncharacterized protein n=1 Tax=Candidatus Roizmanbacteria bacterium GW2011_GWC2_35_12 TaxID=1618485 RepID=A0A0G0BQ71_9BACT|nr:MAG: hypothetical protein UR63_C0044G0017 [Candidatus Roizmanbacteria bacterium GW2011_GWC2_35_12]
MFDSTSHEITSGLSFEEQALAILGKDRVLGRDAYKVIEEEYNKQPSDRPQMRFVFDDKEPKVNGKYFESLHPGLVLTRVPSSMEFISSEETTEGIKQKIEKKLITIRELKKLFPEIYDQRSNDAKYADDPIEGGWTIESNSSTLTTQAMEIHKTIKFGNTKTGIPTPQYYLMAYMRDYLLKRGESPFLKTGNNDQDTNVVYCRKDDQIIQAVGRSKIAQNILRPNIFFNNPTSNKTMNTVGKVINVGRVKI